MGFLSSVVLFRDGIFRQRLDLEITRERLSSRFATNPTLDLELALDRNNSRTSQHSFRNSASGIEIHTATLQNDTALHFALRSHLAWRDLCRKYFSRTKS